MAPPLLTHGRHTAVNQGLIGFVLCATNAMAEVPLSLD